MFKLHHCTSGTPVSEQVFLYQRTRSSDDFLPVLLYYDNFRDYWFKQVEEHIDRPSFDSEYEFRLIRAVDTFDYSGAMKNAQVKNLSILGNFNRWFYTILSNWISNVKTSTFRVSKRPQVCCPVCSKPVIRIDEQHLKHIRTTKDLPQFIIWNNNVYEMRLVPREYVISWGKKDAKKIRDLEKGLYENYISERRRIRWPWKINNKQKGVLCPFTKNIVAKIDNEYLVSLPPRFRHFAPPLTWTEFASQYPSSMVHSEIYSLDYSKNYSSNEQELLTTISSNHRVPDAQENLHQMDIEDLEHIIDNNIEDKTDNKILKMILYGYNIVDISEDLKINMNELKNRMKQISQKSDFKELLLT